MNNSELVDYQDTIEAYLKEEIHGDAAENSVEDIEDEEDDSTRICDGCGNEIMEGYVVYDECVCENCIESKAKTLGYANYRELYDANAEEDRLSGEINPGEVYWTQWTN